MAKRTPVVTIRLTTCVEKKVARELRRAAKKGGQSVSALLRDIAKAAIEAGLDA